MKSRQVDVLVIGSGLAGIRAAIEARRYGMEVLVVSRSATGKANNSAISKGYFAVPDGLCDPCDSPARHLEDILTGGGGIGDPELVTVMVENMKEEVALLAECGVSLSRKKDGNFLCSRVPGHSFPRVMGTNRNSGVQLLSPLVTRAMEMGVRAESGITLISLVKEGGFVTGAWGYTGNGDAVVISSRAVILATGGAGGLYLRTNNVPGTDGLGHAIALDAGLPLVDMEFVQFYPTYLHMPGLPRVMISYETLVAAAGATLRNRDGHDIREIHGLLDGASLTRDMLSRVIESEIASGRGVGPEGRAVVMDFSTMKNPEKYRKYLPKAVSPGVMQVEVSPVAHFTMGGVAVEAGGKTGIPGLWAIGEAAGGIHGANRIGGNALAECLALGRVAGAAASRYSSGVKLRDISPAGAVPVSDTGKEACVSQLAVKIRGTMTGHAGILRDAAGLEEALNEINILRVKAEEENRREKTLAGLKICMMLDVAEAVCLSALMRKESRGSHFRSDYPEENEKYLGNIFVNRKNGKMDAQFVPRRRKE
ncbi:MAG: FAD-dependent oxidoreductase [Bacillota bacterium]